MIGGGIIGVSAAYFLAKKGRSVALVEKGRIAAEQSSRNWGWCRTQNRDERELPLQLVSMELWDSLPATIGADMGFRRNGLIYATKSEEELATWSAWIDMARTYQVRNRVLSAAETKATDARQRAGLDRRHPRPRRRQGGAYAGGAGSGEGGTGAGRHGAAKLRCARAGHYRRPGCWSGDGARAHRRRPRALRRRRLGQHVLPQPRHRPAAGRHPLDRVRNDAGTGGYARAAS